MRLTRVRIRDVRSVWGPPAEVPLGAHVTVLVGPNRSGTSNVAFAIAAALDPQVRFEPSRDLPRGRRGSPSVELQPADGGHATVHWGPDDGSRRVDGSTDEGHAIVCQVTDTPLDLLERATRTGDGAIDTDALATVVHDLAVEVIPEVSAVTVADDGDVVLVDDLGSAIAAPEARAIVALALACHLAAVGRPPAVTVVESPDAFLHPAGQGAMARLLLRVAEATEAPVLVTTTSPFVVPRVEEAMVVALARDAMGRTAVGGAEAGDGVQAPLLGGLLPDAGLGNVLDRIGWIDPTTRAVLIVEGGTDEAYLQLVAAHLGREDVFDGVDIRPAGGAMAAAMSAIVLRAELDIDVVVLLDHDEIGRRARDTLTSRFGFDRATQVVTYADVFDGHPRGIEAETLFDVGLLRRFVAARGRGVSHGEVVCDGIPHVDLTSSGKSAFVGWVGEHARVEHLDRWDALLDRLAERFDT